ncbi:MAG: hypothetical protein C4531_01660 [Desulfurivibrio sp.]|nr:MAG: hypothetical protein C4531_01660 [Desulfurivibrio sp.]
MDPVKMLGYLGRALQKKGDVREEIIAEVNNLSAALLQACIYTSMRFNQALLKKDLAEKREILVSMTNGEIEAHARMNQMCAPIMHAAIELRNFFSDENLHTPINKKNDLLLLFESLVAGERGMQGFMEEYINIAELLQIDDPAAIDDHLKAGIGKLKGLMKSAQQCQFGIPSLL